MLRNDSPALRRAWHPVLEEAQLGDGLVRVELLGEGYVVGRVDGEIVAFPDRCPHRNARLSDGAVVTVGGLAGAAVVGCSLLYSSLPWWLRYLALAGVAVGLWTILTCRTLPDDAPRSPRSTP